jgi:hypothetical protein
MWFESLRSPISDLRSPSFLGTALDFACLFAGPDFKFQIRSISVRAPRVQAGGDASVRSLISHLISPAAPASVQMPTNKSARKGRTNPCRFEKSF